MIRIGDSVFKHCYSLRTITIPDSVTSIGKSAFHGCHNLKSIIIPNRVIYFGYDAFLFKFQ